MLLLSKSVINQPVMSLRTGGQVAFAYKAIFNPNNLKIEGFYCNDSVDKKKELILVYQDIRDVLPAGLVVDDHSVLSEVDDLIRLKKIIDIDFDLFGKVVITENKKRLGRVNDFAVEPTSMMIKKIYVGQSMIKSFASGSMSIDRNQIIEINNRKIIVKEPLKPVLQTSNQENSAPIFNTI